MVQIPVDNTKLVEEMAALTAIANSWMLAVPEQIYVLASKDAAQITAMIQYLGRQTAILNVNRIPDPLNRSVELLLIGNRA